MCMRWDSWDVFRPGLYITPPTPHPPLPADGCLPVGLSSCFLSLHCLDVNITVQHLLQPLLPSQFLLAHQHIFLLSVCPSSLRPSRFSSRVFTGLRGSLTRAPQPLRHRPLCFAFLHPVSIRMLPKHRCLLDCTFFLLWHVT